MLKKIKLIWFVLLLLGFILFEGIAIVTPAVAKNRVPKITFSAGTPINQGGEIVGCRCPKLSGACVCEYDNTAS
jgi:hypothetical protein